MSIPVFQKFIASIFCPDMLSRLAAYEDLIKIQADSVKNLCHEVERLSGKLETQKAKKAKKAKK
jgi:hypothetical protein